MTLLEYLKASNTTQFLFGNICWHVYTKIQLVQNVNASFILKYPARQCFHKQKWNVKNSIVLYFSFFEKQPTKRQICVRCVAV